jgi:hypothetical protein
VGGSGIDNCRSRGRRASRSRGYGSGASSRSEVHATQSLGSPIVAAIVCTVVAMYVFVGMVFYPDTVRTWRRVSAVALILSFMPCVLLAISHMMGGGWPEACALMTMHVVVWAICATILPSLAITKHPPKAQAPDRPLSILLA